MGYRSEVAYVIAFKHTENGEALFYTFLAEAKAKQETALCFEDGLEISESKMTMVFTADHVKWYSDYPDVMCHNALLELADEYISQEFIRCEQHNHNLREEFKAKYGVEVKEMGFKEIEEKNIKLPEWVDEDIGYSFARIGENDDDSETRWGGWQEALDRCQLSRVIDLHLD